jgi:hypothetical protein
LEKRTTGHKKKGGAQGLSIVMETISEVGETTTRCVLPAQPFQPDGSYFAKPKQTPSGHQPREKKHGEPIEVHYKPIID